MGYTRSFPLASQDFFFELPVCGVLPLLLAGLHAIYSRAAAIAPRGRLVPYQSQVHSIAKSKVVFSCEKSPP